MYESQFLHWPLNGRDRMWSNQHESMNSCNFVLMLQAGGNGDGGLMVGGIYSWHILKLLILIRNLLNMASVADWVMNSSNVFSMLKWPPQFLDLSPIKQLWEVVEREI